jgi:FMN phosphatase YigB (HAD superfamily)
VTRAATLPSVLLLDLDGTLVDRDAALVAWLSSKGLDASARAPLVDLDRGGHGPRPAFFAAVGDALDLDAARARALFLRELPGHVAIRPAVAAWLDAFDGPKIVVTNGTSRLQRAKLDAASLADHVDAVVTSQEHRAAKPTASIFRAALALAGGSPRDALMIGDHPQHDVAGAERVGVAARMVRSRWFDVPPGVSAVDSVCEVALR